jgi:hypothetical protein
MYEKVGSNAGCGRMDEVGIPADSVLTTGDVVRGSPVSRGHATAQLLQDRPTTTSCRDYRVANDGGIRYRAVEEVTATTRGTTTEGGGSSVKLSSCEGVKL